MVKSISTSKCPVFMPIVVLIHASAKRTPSWTDRILFTTSGDDPSHLSNSKIETLVYAPVPSYTTSDHKPVMAILRLPVPQSNATSIPTLSQPPQFSNDAAWQWKRYVGKVVGWCIGWTWCLFSFVGGGNTVVGVTFLGLAGIFWWNYSNF